MTNTEKIALKTCAKRIEQLASLENASFHINYDKNEKIKRIIKPYMMWFESVARDIEKIVELSEEKGTFKQEELEEIIRLNL